MSLFSCSLTSLRDEMKISFWGSIAQNDQYIMLQQWQLTAKGPFSPEQWVSWNGPEFCSWQGLCPHLLHNPSSLLKRFYYLIGLGFGEDTSLFPSTIAFTESVYLEPVMVSVDVWWCLKRVLPFLPGWSSALHSKWGMQQNTLDLA